VIIISFLVLKGFFFHADIRVTSTSAGWDQTCVVVMSGNVLCWGYNINGQLIENSSKVESRPKVVEIEEGNAAALY
jgi:alpha-tubulin suppressor-like RCC1 family protein